MLTTKATIAPDRDAVRMRHKQKMDYETLRSEAEDAVKYSGKTQKQIAEELGVSNTAISRAIREAGSKFASLQCEIIGHLTDYRVEEETVFRAYRKN